ncbi:MAG TPA: S46 family peptidase [Oligoflexus sp.]|uniref:S46 family peptidase n=1 Tax=Oligoflexus sp. TaxID=1971216 RepID=UPI002D74379A|nr:S46 family peptidase [Oligoflexus sp.]HYX36639.1 S46 family peptidase [Oligoflexus sp.]
MLKRILFPSLIIALPLTAQADEGQWQPHQLPLLKSELKRIGIQTPAEKLADLNRAPMTAIVSLGGCSASFVSPKGLIVTNHHCAYGDIQHNSTAQRNFIADGFLARSRTEELPASPNTRIYVTDRVDDVTKDVLNGLDAKLSGKARYEGIEKRIKALIATCEQDKAYRCSVPSFHRGMEYYRIRQMMIRDVRLVYAPSDKIGNFGGEIDNFEWPRHTGDFAFLRAYVGKDGRPADPSPENVPLASKDFLTVSAEGLKNGDPILLAGYPGRTNRYKLPSEIRFVRDLSYPRRVAEYEADLAAIAQATKNNQEASVRYASVAKSISNGLKKTKGLLEGFGRRDIATIKDEQQAEFRKWMERQPNAKTLQGVLAEMDQLIQADFVLTEQQFAWSVATKSDLLTSAIALHRLAVERQKPDAERESGYQDRDLPFIKARLSRLEQTFVSEVDQTRWNTALQRYRKLPGDTHPLGLDALLPDVGAIPGLYQNSTLHDTNKRLEWMSKDLASLTQSNDTLVQLAVKLHDINMSLQNRRKEIDGNLDRVIPEYMRAVIAWKKSQGKPVYPDANSTLRVTYGTVASYAPKDGLVKGPFTTVEGILEKYTGKTPFDTTKGVLDAIHSHRYSVYKDKSLGTVPVNFLSTADTTGGNSGSAVMNKRGELVGLNFDSTYESVTKDWYFDPLMTRAIHVDIRYMLWIMAEVDKAENLLKEMTIRYPSAKDKSAH